MRWSWFQPELELCVSSQSIPHPRPQRVEKWNEGACRSARNIGGPQKMAALTPLCRRRTSLEYGVPVRYHLEVALGTRKVSASPDTTDFPEHHMRVFRMASCPSLVKVGSEIASVLTYSLERM